MIIALRYPYFIFRAVNLYIQVYQGFLIEIGYVGGQNKSH